MPDTAHKFQNPLFGSTPGSLSGSDSPMCHIEAYTPATAAKPMQAVGSAEPGSGAGQTSEVDESNTPMHMIVRRDIFEDMPGSSKESEAGASTLNSPMSKALQGKVTAFWQYRLVCPSKAKQRCMKHCGYNSSCCAEQMLLANLERGFHSCRISGLEQRRQSRP